MRAHLTGCNRVDRFTLGFTLMELLIGVAIAAIISALAVPAFATLIRNNRSASEAQALLALLQLARSEALQRNRSVVACKSANGVACSSSGGWEQGVLIFVDSNGNGALNSGEAVLHQELPLSTHSLITGNSPVANRVAFNSLGRSSVSGTITVKPEGVDQQRRAIVLSSTRGPRSCQPDRIPSDCP